MENGVRLSVLWIDDIPADEFLNEAYKYDLEITPATSVNAGLALMKDMSKIWDAIILDANCRITEDPQEQTSLMALKEALHNLVNLRPDVPWFVYTGGDYEGVEHLEFMIKERVYDDRLFYEKPKQRYELYDNIKKAVKNSQTYRIRQKYADVCSFYKYSDLVDLLVKYETDDDFNTDKEVPHSVRLIIEWIMRHFEGVGLLPISFTGTNIAKCSASLAEIPQIVPIHVARSMHFCVEVCNNGSHRDEIEAYLVSDEAPYLNKSIILNLLNILQWCPSLKRFEKEELKKKVAQYQQETREKKKNKKNNE